MAATAPTTAAPVQGSHGPPAPPLQNHRAQKSFDKFFEKYTWAKDETPAEGDEQRMALTMQLDKLVKAKSQLKPGDPRRAEAERHLGIMREKSKEAAQREGRKVKVNPDGTYSSKYMLAKQAAEGEAGAPPPLRAGGGGDCADGSSDQGFGIRTKDYDDIILARKINYVTAHGPAPAAGWAAT